MDPKTADLTELVRQFIANSALSQADLAQHAQVSLKSVNNVHRGERAGKKVDEALRDSIEQLIDEGHAGAFGLGVRVDRLEARLSDLESQLDGAVKRLTDLRTPGD